MGEKAEENKQKTKEFQKKQREERKKMIEAATSETGFGMSAMGDELKQLEGEYSDSSTFSDEEVEDLIEESDEHNVDFVLDELFCIACDKYFKTIGARENHESSKKHKDNINRLVEEMREENGSNEMEEIEEVVKSDDFIPNEESDSEHDTSEENLTKSKKKKKKGGGNVKSRVEVPEELSDVDNEFLKPLVSDEEIVSKSNKGKKKQSKKKDKLKTNDTVNTPAYNENEGDIGNPDVDCSSLDNQQLKNTREHLVERKYSKKQSKHSKQNEPEIDENLHRGDLNCAQCNQTFQSKNKLYNHLKSSGHAVYLPKGGPDPIPTNKSKRKKEKK